jgi:putative heme-binding domain-containing protein
MSLDLAHVRAYSRDRVLSAIIEPNAEIRAQWTTYFVQNRQGEVWTGLLADDNPIALTLLLPGRDPLVLPHENMHHVEAQSWSLMPAGLEAGLTPQNMADLIEYLCPR